MKYFCLLLIMIVIFQQFYLKRPFPSIRISGIHVEDGEVKRYRKAILLIDGEVYYDDGDTKVLLDSIIKKGDGFALWGLTDREAEILKESWENK